MATVTPVVGFTHVLIIDKCLITLPSLTKSEHQSFYFEYGFENLFPPVV